MAGLCVRAKKILSEGPSKPVLGKVIRKPGLENLPRLAHGMALLRTPGHRHS